MEIKKHINNGFTVVETMAAIFIIGVIASVVTISYVGIQSRAIDTSVLSDLNHMDVAQTNYGLKNNVAGKEYYSINGPDSELGFTPSSGNIIDVVISSTEYCIRGYNLKGSKNSIDNAYIKESTKGVCSSLPASDPAIGATTPRSPGTVASDSSVGTNSWSNTANIADSNDTYASVDLSDGDFAVGGTVSTRPNYFTAAGYTLIHRYGPSTVSGTIDTVKMYFYSAASGVLVGTFYGSGTTWTNRGYANIGSVSSGSMQTFSNLDIPVEVGDYLGYYLTGGQPYVTSGGGYTYIVGNKFGAGTVGGYTVAGTTSDYFSMNGTGKVNKTSHYLKATNYGFTIPNGSTINGIQVEIERRTSGLTNESAVRIVKSNGSIGTTEKSTGAALPGSDSYVIYGGATDLWGETWTASDINNSNFGIALSTIGTGVSYVDHMRIKVFYTAP